MPARIYPLPFAQHEDLSDAAGLVDSLAAGLKLVGIVGVNRSGVAINLDCGFGKLAESRSGRMKIAHRFIGGIKCECKSVQSVKRTAEVEG
jgi:hypothetical protein